MAKQSPIFKWLLPSTLVVLLGLGATQFFPISGSNAESLNLKESSPVSIAAASEKNIPKGETRFIAMGDPGSGVKQQYDMAAEMLDYFNLHPYQAVLVLGDNIYPDGDVDKLGESNFNKPYRPLREGKGVPFIISLGNHDLVRGDVDKQLKFYHMPNRFYEKSVGSDGLVDVFVLDTNIYEKDKTQQEWLDKALGSSKATWKIVMGHHPIYSSGLHGNHRGLIRTLQPILEKHHVPLYVAGHDHNYERFSTMNGVTYLVSGGGGAYLRKFGLPKQHSVVRDSLFHFVAFDVTDKKLYARAINREGKAFDSFELIKH